MTSSQKNPTLSLQGDVAATRLIIDAQDGPVVLVGHSYGGAVISEAGADPKVAALAYICAFAPDRDESVNTLIAGFPAGGPQPPILPPRDGFLFLDRNKFHASFAADVPAEVAAFMADSQVPWGLDALGGTVTDPAWRTKPSWYLVTTEDQMIPPSAQRTMSERAGSTVVEVAASHSVYVSQPAAVADLIKQAAVRCRRTAVTCHRPCDADRVGVFVCRSAPIPSLAARSLSRGLPPAPPTWTTPPYGKGWLQLALRELCS